MPCHVKEKRFQLRHTLMAEWAARLAQPSAGHATIVAVRPMLTEWLERRHGALTFRLTQVLTGHGCFGAYLHRIGREESSGCHHCGHHREDTAHHTLVECPAWAVGRLEFEAVVGAGSLSLPTIVSAMVQSESASEGTVAFCEAVMSSKEAAERERERAAISLSTRRPGRRDLRPP